MRAVAQDYQTVSPSSQVDSPANLFPLQDDEKEHSITATSDRKLLPLFKHTDRLSVCLKMLLVSPRWYSPQRKLLWIAKPILQEKLHAISRSENKASLIKYVTTSKVKDIPSKRLLFRLAVSQLPTNETEYGLWRTPDTGAGGTSGALRAGYIKRKSGAKIQIKLEDQVRNPNLWPTPNTMDHLPQRSTEALHRQAATTRKGRTRPANLREQVNPETMRLWLTPTAVMIEEHPNKMQMRAKENGYKNRTKIGSLASQVKYAPITPDSAGKMWPTPQAGDEKDREDLSNPCIQR